MIWEEVKKAYSNQWVIFGMDYLMKAKVIIDLENMILV